MHKLLQQNILTYLMWHFEVERLKYTEAMVQIFFNSEIASKFHINYKKQ